jgi:DNA-binding response OmpR family regulator
MRIIIVENDPIFSSVLTEHLRDHGHEVYLFESISDFESVLKMMVPEVVITDLLLAGISGKELVDFYKQFECPLYVMSSVDKEDLIYFSQEVGAKGYFHKPFHSEQLMEELNRL